ncbi:hypothetical protein GCM10027167_45550 [Nocardia heshunensis]
MADIANRVPLRRRAGWPRFKKKHLARPTMNYTLRGHRLIDGALILAGGISVRVVWSRDLPGVPSSVRIYCDALGHWYASFVVAAPRDPLASTGSAIGIDWGVATIATTTSTTHDLAHPQYGRTSAARLSHCQRAMARRRPARGTSASAGYRRAKIRTARLHMKVARQRRDTAHKWAKAVVRDFDRIAVEDFRPRFLAGSKMARKAADAAIGASKLALTAMARKHGREIAFVPPQFSTMDCGRCGARTKHHLPLSLRTYTCARCGQISNRDLNAARVVLNRAGFAPAGAENVRPVRLLNDQAV